MPVRKVVNKYNMFVKQIRSLSKRHQLTNEEKKLLKMAKIIAALSSRSWKTYSFLSGQGDLDDKAISEEFLLAFKEGWQYITENDINEVVSTKFDQANFYIWLNKVAKNNNERKEIERIFNTVRNNFKDGFSAPEIKED